jgi:hypothetical protein
VLFVYDRHSYLLRPWKSEGTGSFVLMSRVHPLDLIPKYLRTQVFPEHASPLSIGVRDGTLGLCSFVITPIIPTTLLRTLLSLYFLFLMKLLLGFAPSSRVRRKGGERGARLGLRGRTLKAKISLVNCYLWNTE